MGSGFRRDSGFSLIELMVVVATLALVASISIPQYVRHQRAAAQAECPENLKYFVAAERDFFEENGRLAGNLSDLNWAPKGQPIYRYDFKKVSENTYTIDCMANLDDDPVLDRFNINDRGEITHISNDLEE